MIEFIIPGKLRGKGRPKFVRATGRTYTDEKTRNAEAMIRSLGFDAMAGRSPLEGPVMLELTVWIAKPQSWSRKRRAESTYYVGKPDADNQGKCVSDALNGICYRDDSQVADLHVRRFYTEATERTVVRIRSLGVADAIVMGTERVAA